MRSALGPAIVLALLPAWLASPALAQEAPPAAKPTLDDGPPRAAEAPPDEGDDETWTLPELVARLAGFEYGLETAAVYQHLESGERDVVDDVGRGAVNALPWFDWGFTNNDHLFVKLAFADRDALDEVSPFALSAWDGDPEDGVEDINGRSRDHILEALYAKRFHLGPDRSLRVSAGIIDASAYIDGNRFANDSYHQFLNEAFVNGPVGSIPSYDYGVALQWEAGSWDVQGVVMRVGENDDGEEYTWGGVTVGRTFVDQELGQGHVGVTVTATGDDFLDRRSGSEKRLKSVMVSADQELGQVLGVWTRFGTQDDAASVVHRDLISGGLRIDGEGWGRDRDEIGIGYAYLSDGTRNVERTHVLEAYKRFQLGDLVTLTFDVQYMEDDGRGPRADVDGWIFGLRLVVDF